MPAQGRAKMAWKKLMENDCCEWKLRTVKHQRTGVRPAMVAVSEVPGRGPHWCRWCHCTLTLKAPITTAEDDKFCDIFHNFRQKIRYDITWNRLPADDSHEISCLIGYFWKSSKIWNCRLLQIIDGALRVNQKPNILDGWLRMGLLPPPLGNFADISYLVENWKPSLLRDVCTLCSGALVC